ncbi:unnamed protein product [Hermetia illucens]|uniref:Uncharacterized protein n=1 Tax=Hermetia illucens TaxID=343691 RepID=A0A7R8UB34_HERIL|nr:unnamed protein product [Hermetia illucens]
MHNKVPGLINPQKLELFPTAVFRGYKSCCRLRSVLSDRYNSDGLILILQDINFIAEHFYVINLIKVKI